MKEKNPINNVHFYCKDNPTKTVQIRKNQVQTEDQRIQIFLFIGFSQILNCYFFSLHEFLSFT